MSTSLLTAWRGNDLMVMRQDKEVDRIPANDIRREYVELAGDPSWRDRLTIRGVDRLPLTTP